MKPLHAYVVRETAISVVINALLSIAFAATVFHGQGYVSAHGPGGLVRDAAAQTGAIALMGSLVPAWLTLRRSPSAALTTPPRVFRPSHFALRAVLIAAVATICGVCLTAVLLHSFVGLRFSTMLAFKTSYGAVEAAIVTPAAVVMALHDSARIRAQAR